MTNNIYKTHAMIFTIEGNIGAGKTTLLEALEKTTFKIPHIVYYEPVDNWMQCRLPGLEESKSLFELYYEDRKKYAFVFQMMALQSRYENMLSAMRESPNTIVFCERSFLTDYEIFAKINNEEGNISDMELHVYKKWHSFFLESIDHVIKGIVYLNTDPEVCKERIQKRNRLGEELSDEYLFSLHTKHQKWLSNQTLAPCIHVNGEIPDIINQIKTFVESVV